MKCFSDRNLIALPVFSSRARAWALSLKISLAYAMFCLPIPTAFGQDPFAAPIANGEDPFAGPGGPFVKALGAISNITKATAFRERCLLLITKFQHNGVEFQSKSGIGCVVSTPQGQRILAMPASMITPIDVVQGREKLSIACSMLLATKLGNSDKIVESLATFSDRVEDFPLESPRKQPPSEPMKESERRIYRALDESGEADFNQQPLSLVLNRLSNQYQVPIVIDQLALQKVKFSSDEPVSLQLPKISLRSALNLILEPLELSYAIDNEFLVITTKAKALAAQTLSVSDANCKGLIAVGSRPMSMGGIQETYFQQFTATQRYNSLQEAQKADADFPTNRDGQRREFAAVHGPLVAFMNENLGIAFISLPGDFQSVAVPSRIEDSGKRFVGLVPPGAGWFDITEVKTGPSSEIASVIDGSPVVDERGEPVGLFTREKVVTLPKIVQALLAIDTKLLGYWGAETKEAMPEEDPFGGPTSKQPNDEIPQLITAEINAMVDRLRSLQEKDKAAELKSIQSKLDERTQLRKNFIAEKLKSLHSKLSQLTELSDRMNKQDIEKARKILSATPASSKQDEEPENDDPFR